MGNTQLEKEREELLQEWLPFSVRYAIAKKHGMTVTKEFNALVRDVIHEMAVRRTQVVPRGWKIVPLVSDEKMQRAIAAQFHGTVREAIDVWDEALAAAPMPPEADHIPDAGEMVAKQGINHIKN